MDQNDTRMYGNHTGMHGLESYRNDTGMDWNEQEWTGNELELGRLSKNSYC